MTNAWITTAEPKWQNEWLGTLDVSYSPSGQFRCTKCSVLKVGDVKRKENGCISITIESEPLDGEIIFTQEQFDKILKSIGEFIPEELQVEQLFDEKESVENG